MKNIFFKLKNSFYFLIIPFIFSLSGANNANGAVVTLQSPTPKVGTLFDFVVEILKILIKIGIPIVAVLFIYTGYLFVAAQGNEAELKKAKTAFMSSFIGAAILLCGVLLATIVKNTIGQLGG